MALTVVEQAGLSDVGRQREANEDSYVISSPLFAVADGMGGAQAGEVASRTAAQVFAGRDAPDGTPEQRLTSMTREANRRIHDLSQSDATRRGMGTTLTAAMVSPEGLSLAHVGDSRAYRLREGVLEQLTDDHSLVAELERSGQLSREAAEHHPQRSIITRALGPEADVEVDSHTHKALAGDVYLLCSDGLTGMVSDEEMAAILRGAGTLSEATETLIRAANQSGGKDNITVVLFRLGDSEGDEPALEENTLSGSETIHQGLTAADVQVAVEEQERAGAASAATAPGVRPKAAAPTSASAPPSRGRRHRGRRALALLATLLVVVAIGAGAVIGARQVYFVGTDDAGLVTVYRGLPYDLPLGVSLYSERYASSAPARAIGHARRERVLDHEWRSKRDAEDLVRQLERGTLDLGAGGR
jgi:serine/threonine protein phosphatase PrpC